MENIKYFIKECLLFKSKERVNIMLGIWCWLSIASLFITVTVWIKSNGL